MKYLRQFCIILLFSFLGEGLHIILPLPVPASVYGLVLMLAALQTGILKTRQVRETAGRAETCLRSGCSYNCGHHGFRHGSDRTCDPGDYTEGEKEK